MTRKLEWRAVARGEFARLLRQAVVLRAQDLDGATVYHCEHDGRESLAIALAEGACLIVTPAPPTSRVERRRNGKPPG